MNAISPRERLLRVLGRQEVDRPPVICTGGMMNAAIVEIMKKTGHTLPEAHFDSGLMAELAQGVSEYTGFENLGVPFCMTVEAEALGSQIDHGTLACEPKVAREVFPSVSQVVFRDVKTLLHDSRAAVVINAVRELAQKRPELPVIASLTGPVSVAASIVDPMIFLKELRRNREASHRLVSYVTDFLVSYASELVRNGARVIAIGDPTATGEILGPALFEEYAVRYLNELTDRVHALGAPVIVHICGNLNRAKHLIPALRGDTISTDAMVSLRALKEEYSHITTMGNVSTYLLEFGAPDKVARRTQKLVRDGVNIISPACGLSTSTSLANISAMTGAVKGGS